MTASVLDVHDVVWTLFDATSGVHTYDAEVPNTPPLDDDGRVAAYAVLYLAPGRLRSLTLDGGQDSLDNTFQVTCVGGDATRVLWCVDQVCTSLVGAVVTIDGRTHVVRASDVTPAPSPAEEGVKPPRHTMPVLFSLFIP